VRALRHQIRNCAIHADGRQDHREYRERAQHRGRETLPRQRFVHAVVHGAHRRPAHRGRAHALRAEWSLPGCLDRPKFSPYPLLVQIVYLTNAARSNYNALTVAANKRMSKGLQFQVSYNHAKNLSNVGGYDPAGFASEGGGALSEPSDPNLDHGRVAFTRSDRFLSTFLYTLPFRHTGSAIVNQLAGGWELAGVVLFQTGPFLTVGANGADPSGTNFTNLQGSGRVDSGLGAPLYPTNRSSAQWLNPAAFAVPPNNIGRFGIEPVGAAVGPGTQAVSLSFFRTIASKEKVRLRFGIAAANALNHPNSSTPALTLNASTFGTITSLQSAEGAGPRRLQLTGRITF
jgi:hypothetical protein